MIISNVDCNDILKCNCVQFCRLESYTNRDVLSTQRIPRSQQDEAHVNSETLKLKSEENDIDNENAQATSSPVTDGNAPPAGLQQSTSEHAFDKKFSESRPHEQVGDVSAGHDNVPEGTMLKSTAEGRTQSSITDEIVGV